MRRIESAEEIERKAKRRARLFAVMMLIILVGSTAGYAFFSNIGDSNIQPNDDNQGRWEHTFANQKLYLSNSPSAVENVDVEVSMTINDYAGKSLYIASENTGITTEISSTLGLFVSRTQLACYGKCEENLPEKNCTDNLIVWKSSAENKVYQADKCVFIEGDIRAADAFLYTILK